jgi:ubiquinone/menaquinone biosynthesis C-methylase UbiE
MNSEELKRIVKEKYGQMAEQSDVPGQTSCCSPSSDYCSSVDYTIFSESYTKLDGYNPHSDLNLGCGIPTQYAGIKKGDSVLDLGSGAGNDCFVARALAGEEGKVTGIDFTDEMLKKAGENVKKLGFTNVVFVKGDIEDMPLTGNEFDVVLSNCVLNLVPDKYKAFSEIFRVLKPDGHFCISDVVLKGELPSGLKNDTEMYTGCVAGASEMNLYLEYIKKTGFKDIHIHKQKEIPIRHDLLKKYLTEQEIDFYRRKEKGIYSITVSAIKPK